MLKSNIPGQFHHVPPEFYRCLHGQSYEHQKEAAKFIDRMTIKNIPGVVETWIVHGKKLIILSEALLKIELVKTQISLYAATDSTLARVNSQNYNFKLNISSIRD